MKKLFTCLSLLTMCLLSFADNGEELLEKGNKYFKDRLYKDAVECYTMSINAGYVGLIGPYWKLAECYEYGKGVKRDNAKAEELRDEGAKKKDFFCILFLKNRENAFSYSLMWAEKGDFTCQHYVASMYESGDGTDKNLHKAALWYRIASFNNEYGKDYYKAYKRLARKGYDISEAEARNKFNQINQARDNQPQRNELAQTPAPAQQSAPVIARQTIPAQTEPQLTTPNPVSDVDFSIPVCKTVADKTFAVIIANENYSSISNVECASNDGRVFAEYCNKTLGIPQNHIITNIDATYGIIERALSRIEQIGEAYEGKLNIVFYYAGHGVPDEKTREAYLIPADGDGSALSTCFKTSTVYKRLAAIKAESTVVLLDACFSGSVRGEGMLASARGVRLATKEDTIDGNMVIISAASGDQTAYPYTEKGHGMFTYYLLKKLQASSGRASLGEIADYVQSEVKKESIVSCGRIQTPTVIPSPIASSGWRDWTF